MNPALDRQLVVNPDPNHHMNPERRLRSALDQNCRAQSLKGADNPCQNLTRPLVSLLVGLLDPFRTVPATDRQVFLFCPEWGQDHCL
jgi:hypothetical protein